jgi:hypothetical protein
MHLIYDLGHNKWDVLEPAQSHPFVIKDLDLKQQTSMSYFSIISVMLV